MDCVCARRQMILWGAAALCLLVMPASVSLATIYDFLNDGGEYNGTILGQNPLFVPGGVRSLPEFNNLYNPANNSKILDHLRFWTILRWAPVTGPAFARRTGPILVGKIIHPRFQRG
jgi:hypothetical protein